MFDVFLSHSHIDSVLVEHLAKLLEDRFGLQVWLDKWVLVPGEHWQQKMARALSDAKSCAVCIGEQTPSGWFKEEIERALNRQTKDDDFRVIPVLLPKAENVNVDDFLELRTWVDLQCGIDDEQALHPLVCGIKGVAPGRSPNTDNQSFLDDKMLNNLEQIQKLRKERLIDESIALEYQRRIMDKLIRF